MKRVFFFVLVISVLLTPLIVSADTLRVVTSANFPPYEFIEGSEIVGIDIDIAREMLRRNGYDMIVEDMKFDSVIVSLQTGKGDIAASDKAADRNTLIANLRADIARAVADIKSPEKTLDEKNSAAKALIESCIYDKNAAIIELTYRIII